MTSRFVPEDLDPDVGARFAAARDATHRTCYSEADALLAEALADGPDHPLPLAYAAVVARVLYRDPMPLVERARALVAARNDPRDALAEALLGFASRDLEAWEERVRAYLGDVPDDPFARHFLGAALYARGSAADAVTVLEALLEDNPRFAPVRNHLGAAYLALGERERGVATLRRWVEEDPGNASARDSLADGLVEAGDVEAAIAQLVRAVLLEPGFAYGWLHLGEILEELGDIAAAAQSYRTARETPGAYGPAFIAAADQRLARVLAVSNGPPAASLNGPT